VVGKSAGGKGASEIIENKTQRNAWHGEKGKKVCGKEQIKRDENAKVKKKPQEPKKII
jgi:hypothetical protein